MELIYGNEERAIDFLKKITEKDRVAIFSHTDVDGFVAGRVMNETIPAEVIQFLDYSPQLIANLIPIIKEKKIQKVIFTDLNLEQNKADVKKLAEIAEILIIDHHEYSEDLNSERVIFIKTPSTTCASYTTYVLLTKTHNTHLEKLDWLVGSAVIADYTFESHQEFIKKIEEKYHFANQAKTNSQAFQSDLGKIAIIINNATIYFDDKTSEFYSLFKKINAMKDISFVDEYANTVQKEIDRVVDNFVKFHEAKNDLFYYQAAVNYGITSAISTILSGRYPKNTIIFLADYGQKMIKISARRQDGKVNLPQLLGTCMDGLKETTFGGHFKAAGGSFLKKDLEKFKKRLFALALVSTQIDTS